MHLISFNPPGSAHITCLAFLTVHETLSQDETTQRSSRKPLEDYLTILAEEDGFEPSR